MTYYGVSSKNREHKYRKIVHQQRLSRRKAYSFIFILHDGEDKIITLDIEYIGSTFYTAKERISIFVFWFLLVECT